MKYGVSQIERAFELARSGREAGVSEIKKALKGEGYCVTEFEGRALSKQLRDIIKAVREKQKRGPIPTEDLNASNDE